MDVSVVVCTYNRAQQLAEVLDTLARQEHADNLEWELVVVDNNSKDETKRVVELFAERHPEIDVVYVFEAQQGKSFALNTGVQTARGRIIAFTDDDVFVGDGWLQATYDAFEKLGCTVMAGRVRALWQRPKPQWLADMGSLRIAAAIVEYDHGDEAFRIAAEQRGIGANMAVRKDVFERCGLYRTDIGPTSKSLMRCEDSELFERVIEAGEPAYYVPDAVIDHPVEEFRTEKSYFLRFYHGNARSRMRIDGVPDVPCIANVPRYLIRDAVGKFLRWQLTLSPSLRFQRKLHFWSQLGAIHEARLINGEAQSMKLQSSAE